MSEAGGVAGECSQAFKEAFKEGLLRHHVPRRAEAVQPADAASLLREDPGAGNTDIPNGIVGPMLTDNSVLVYMAKPVMSRGAEVKDSGHSQKSMTGL